MIARVILLAVVFMLVAAAAGHAESTDPQRDILVTFDNRGAERVNPGAAPPYRFRKRYSVSGTVRRLSREIAREYGLDAVDHWPIRSLSVYCFVYRVPEGQDRDSLVARLDGDERIESVQVLQRFETRLDPRVVPYNDPYLKLQHGLRSLGVIDVHRSTLGQGVRIAIIDSNVDLTHEDLQGRIHTLKLFVDRRDEADVEHGTAVASVIGASANNALGIVGVAPAATLDVLVSCWHEDRSTVCDSFTLAKALDYVLQNPPEVVNLSLTGPEDRLVGRLIHKVLESGIIVVAADPGDRLLGGVFPASIPGVIAIGQSEEGRGSGLLAPGEQIVVAAPRDTYEMRSGSSLSAAHASGVIALLLSLAPDTSPASLHEILRRSQVGGVAPSIDACAALQLAAGACHPERAVRTE